MTMFPEIENLRHEPAAQARVETRNGAPRLFLNGREVFPLLAWSWSLLHSTPFFKQAGLRLLHPILGLNAAWPAPGEYDWSAFDALFAKLLAQHPQAFFLPRVLLEVPQWWKDQHEDELIVCALPLQPEDQRQYRPVIQCPEGGWQWGIQLREPSLASERWRADMEKLFRAFLQHIEQSPLRSRVFGYQIGCGIYGEWHYPLAEFVPDLHPAMQEKLGHVPDFAARRNNTFGLLRDPACEQKVITYYQRFHEFNAGVLLHFARLTREETNGRVICGAFHGYQLENVWMQEGGHLAPGLILNSPDIDFLAGPYSYQTTNQEARQWWEHDIFDEAGNWLGRTRGIGGDAGYRVLLQSLKRHGKLYFVEIDPTTFLEPPPVNPDGSGGTAVEKELCMLGGEGCTTWEGTQRILQRDLGRLLVSGNGGWLFDFGPVLRTRRSWYADDRIIAEVARMCRLGEQRSQWDLRSCAQIAAVYDAKSLFATRHWRAEAPFSKGGHCLDYFTRWFMDSQARALHRVGAPVDFLYRFDLQPADPYQYRLLLMVNLFLLTEAEMAHLHALLAGSNATVVWYYAPGFLAEDRLDPGRMTQLTGFQFKLLAMPGPMLIRSSAPAPVLSFGVQQKEWPRFAVRDEAATPLGFWSDCEEVAFARKSYQGWNSVYLGSAPLPVPLLRWLAQQAGVPLWSSAADVIVAAQDAALLVATSPGKRELTLPKEMKRLRNGTIGRQHELNLAFGDVELFVPPHAAGAE
ncbi:MAG: hypothetical protein ONB48_20225 [candidate division KSB1 bacterium]|nr:hypothetical protein [candidate division KSB1 bacterium]MDZ7276219.1 hypothetical protein [candidate division KSB1 bacterium]MDZ7287975.1 hypothetical protein [candidate division KSB1 bacterium]MDZ7300012.1 hypothetical protein [candidate division KSB1 bacterium]MDZ7308235.1 hypothetical protein [candidate division KSB1 bacterium]